MNAIPRIVLRESDKHTSDLHFGHRNIIQYCRRPWPSVEHMNPGIVDRWNDVVDPTDRVFVYGDVAMGQLVESLEWVAYLNGEKHLIPGNHDSCWPGARRFGEASIKQYQDAGFIIEPPQVELELSDGTVLDGCHFPYEGDSHESDRYKEHRPADRGRWLIHGHVHDTWKVRGRMINVGVDVWNFAPVSEAQILEIIQAGPVPE